MIRVSFKFSVTSFCALWTSVQTHSEQNLVAAEMLVYSFSKKAYMNGNNSSENCILQKLRCE